MHMNPKDPQQEKMLCIAVYTFIFPSNLDGLPLLYFFL